MLRRVVWWGCALGIASLLALFYAAQDYLSRTVEGNSANWWRMLRAQLLLWNIWVLLAPLIFRLGPHYRIEGQSALRRLPVWLGAGLALGAVQSAVYMTVAHYAGWLTPPPPPEEPNLLFGIWWRINDAMAANLLSFTLIALGYHALAYARDLRERETRGAQLEARLAREPTIEVLRDRKRVFADGAQTVELHEIGPNPHAAQMIIAYVPGANVLLEADMLDLDVPDSRVGTGSVGDDTRALAAAIDRLGLRVDRIVPVHGRLGTLDDLRRTVER